jgi:hypothetical protein
MPNDQTVTTSERLWSEEVGLANGSDPLQPKDVAYEFSNGRKFYDGKGPYVDDQGQVL